MLPGEDPNNMGQNVPVATQHVLLDECHFRTDARGARRRHEPRGARADHHEVVGILRRRRILP